MLRRFLCVISVAALLFSLSACTDMGLPFKLEEFTAIVTVKSTATEIKGELTYVSPEDITFKVSEPENIKGMEFRSVSQSMNVSVGEVSFATDSAKGSPVYMLFGLLKSIAQSAISIPLTGEKEIAFEHEGKICHVKIDCEEKRIVSIETEKTSYIFE